MTTTRLQQQRQGRSCKAVSSLDPRLVPSQSAPTGLPAHSYGQSNLEDCMLAIAIGRLFRMVRLRNANQRWMAVPSNLYFLQTECQDQMQLEVGHVGCFTLVVQCFKQMLQKLISCCLCSIAAE